MKKTFLTIIVLFITCLSLSATNHPSATSFDGIGDITNYHPPDTHGAVGPNDVMGICNLAYEIFDKNGNVIKPSTKDSIFFLPLRSYGVPRRDGRLIYDPFGQRWIFILLYAPTSKSVPLGFFIAISSTSDPTGSWNMWAVPTSAIDYCTLGLNKHWICVGNNLSSKFYVFNRSFMYSSTNSILPQYTILSSAGIWQPCVTLDSAQENLYLVKTDKAKQGSIGLAKIIGSDSLPSFISLPDAHSKYTWSSPAPFAYPQKGTSATVAVGSQDAMMNAVYNAGSLWCANGILLSNPTRAAVAWWQINPDASAIVHAGQIQDLTGVTNYSSPSIVADGQGDALIGFSVFSKNIFPSTGYVLHRPNASVDTINVYYNGFSYYKNSKWGDYSNSAIDPADNSLWTVQSYTGSKNDWATRWLHVSLFSEPPAREELTGKQAALYPSPCQDKLLVSVKSSGVITVTDLSGKVLYSEKVLQDEYKKTIEVSSYAAGFYLFNYQSAYGLETIQFEVNR